MAVALNLENYLSSLLSRNLFLPPGYSYLAVIGLVALSIAMMFKGKETWNILFIVLGAYYGYLFSLYLVSYLNIANLPVYLIFVIGAVIGAILMTFFVRIALSGGFAFFAFLIVRALYPGNTLLTFAVAIIAFILVYALYKKVTGVIAGIIGAFMLWFSLLSLGLPSLYAQIIPGVLLPVGLYLQFREVKKTKRARPRSCPPSDYYPYR